MRGKSRSKRKPRYYSLSRKDPNIPWVPDVFPHVGRGASSVTGPHVFGGSLFKTWPKPETAYEKPLVPRVASTQRERKHVANVWHPLLHGTFWNFNIHFKHNKQFFWKWLRYFKKCLQALPASLFSEKECTLLSIELFFGKMVLKAPSGFCWNLSYVFDFPNGKSYLKSNFSNDCLNTAS